MAIRLDRESDYDFAMACNGYNANNQYQPELAGTLPELFAGRRIAFFGPNSPDLSFTLRDAGIRRFQSIFGSEQPLEVIHKYRKTSGDYLASRLAFLFGGLARYSEAIGRQRRGAAFLQMFVPDNNHHLRIARVANYVAKMAEVADSNSVESVLSAMSMHVMSGGHSEDPQFKGDVFRMADAISQDPVKPHTTSDLGISQLARLMHFEESNGYKVSKKIAQIHQQMGIFEEAQFPTVGAEFHLPGNIAVSSPDIWQKLALANLSQDQADSSIQYSRKDKGVIEVRMAPSYYPVTVANWERLRKLVPEIDTAYFTATINRNDPSELGNFSWDRDQNLLDTLRTIGMLSYAGVFSSIPPTSRSAEIGFGEVYLGQTVKLDQGVYNFTGHWGGNRGTHGQMGVYAGYGKNFPVLMKYLSLALAEPEVVRTGNEEILEKSKTLPGAMDTTTIDRRLFFGSVKNRTEKHPELKKIVGAEAKIKQMQTKDYS